MDNLIEVCKGKYIAGHGFFYDPNGPRVSKWIVFTNDISKCKDNCSYYICYENGEEMCDNSELVHV